MKRIYITLLLITVLLFSGCFRYEPTLNDELPEWLEKKILLSENHEDPFYTIRVLRFIYKDRYVFELSSSKYHYRRVYSYNGWYLGTPDGVFGLPDPGVYDYFYMREDRTAIWKKNIFLPLEPQEEYDIINAALEASFDSIKINLTHTTLYSFHDDMITSKFHFQEIEYDQKMIQDAIEKNIDNFTLDPDLMSDMVTLIDPDTVSAAHASEYHEDYPGYTDMVSVRRPGISSDGNTAIVEMGYDFHLGESCWWICLLEKSDGIWAVTDKIGIFMT